MSRRDAMLPLPHSNVQFSLSLSLSRALFHPHDIFSRHIRYVNEDDHTRTQIDNVHKDAHRNTHMHTCIYTHTHTRTRETYEQAPRITTRPINPPLQAPRITTRPTNPNPHSLHQQTSLLLRVLSPPDRSTAPLSLSESSTSLRFCLAPMHRQAHPRSLSHPFTNLRLSLAPTLSRFQQRSPLYYGLE
jgi:hypothetical protein